MRLLVVEDELHLQQQLSDALRAQQYTVDVASDGEEGDFQLSEYDYDLAIVDLGLPKLDGIALIRRQREQDNRVPMLILTARGDWQDKVEGLEAGADDYLAKPFVMEELLARVSALLRRAVGQATSTLHAGPISLDSHRKEVRLNEQLLELTSFEFKTLEYLMLHADKVISKTELTEHIYEQDHDRDSNVIEVFIGRLRKKLDPDTQLKPIVTVRGQGYRFAL